MIIFLSALLALSERKRPVFLRRIDLVTVPSAKHAIAGHLDVQLYRLATLGFLGENVLDSTVIAT